MAFSIHDMIVIDDPVGWGEEAMRKDFTPPPGAPRQWGRGRSRAAARRRTVRMRLYRKLTGWRAPRMWHALQLNPRNIAELLRPGDIIMEYNRRLKVLKVAGTNADVVVLDTW